VRPDHLVYGVARSAEDIHALMQRACKALGTTLNGSATTLQEPA
jgi:3-(3-hydroxy-phenyl)propionate hydroxylase